MSHDNEKERSWSPASKVMPTVKLELEDGFVQKDARGGADGRMPNAVAKCETSLWQAYIDDIVFSCKKHKEMGEKAFGQLTDDDFFRNPGEHSNSVAAIVKHVAGNLHSRWTDFLTTDGDKPGRDRDAEFVIGPNDTRDRLIAAWDLGWSAMLQTLASLKESDWLKTVRIRGEEHSVMQAIQRSVTHSAYHIGQILYLSRLLTTGDWKWITVPPGQSGQFKVGSYLRRPG